MKKILLSLILILSLALLCSCDDINNSAIDEETTHEHNYLCDCHPNMETVGDTTTEEEIGEITTKEDVVINNPPAIFEKLVYTNLNLDNISIENEGVFVVNIPDEFKLGESISETPINITPENKKFTFGGETYNITLKLGRTKNLFESTDGKVDSFNYYIYKDGENIQFSFVNGTDKLIELRLRDNRETDYNKNTISTEAAEGIALDFMQKYSLATSLEGFKVNCYENDTIRFFYQLTIGGYEVYGEQYVVGLNKNGDIYMYSDETTGLYNKFIDKVTEEDIRDAEERLYPYHMNGAYGYADPYLKVGNDGNLYLCSAYFVDEMIDGVEIAREYMFYSRVYYEE